MLFNAFYHSLGKYMHTKNKKKFSSLDESIYIKKVNGRNVKNQSLFYRKEYYKPVLKMY